MTKRALIHKIIPFSCVDGEGNRMVIFFQGCNFKCTYCHNPETIQVCNACGECIGGCPTGALEKHGQEIKWYEERCSHCDACVRSCPNLSSPKTQSHTVESLMAVIHHASPFIRGVTVSGGECTLNPLFLTALFRQIKTTTKLTCFLDTNGGVDLEAFPDLIQLTDGVMLDVKAFDEVEHRYLTGASNECVLKNLDFLLGQNKLIEVRTVIAKGLNPERTIEEVARRVGNRCIYKLIPYRSHGVRREGLLRHGLESPSEAKMDAYLQISRDLGATLLNTFVRGSFY